MHLDGDLCETASVIVLVTLHAAHTEAFSSVDFSTASTHMVALSEPQGRE